MKVYIAAADKDRAVLLAEGLMEAGHDITSSWLSQEFKRTHQHPEAQRAAIASRDFREVFLCDALVLLDSPDHVPGAKFIEAGIALALGKRVIVSGRRENLLLWHPRVEQVAQDGLVSPALAG